MPTKPMRRAIADPNALEDAAAIIRAGGVVAIPTDTLYGLAVDPFNADAVARLFAAKGRPDDRAIPLIAADRPQIEQHIGPLTPAAARLAETFWPGPLTLLLAAPRAMAAAVSAGTGKVGVRVPDDRCARAICAAAGRPVTATSANVSGEPSTADPSDVERALGDRIMYLFDAGPTKGGPPSTIVDVSVAEPALVRAGAIGWEEIRKWL